MDFARFWEQARELWARPAGKLIFGVVGALIALGLVASFWTLRPQYTTLGSFSSEDAPEIAKTLADKKIQATQRQGAGPSSFVFSVPADKVDDARLALAEINLDPNTSIWAVDQWKARVSWSNTDFDKRVLLKEQLESNITRGLMAMSVVERAKVTLTIPMTPALFKEDIKPPKAGVTILPRKGQNLTEPVIRGIMDAVSSQVEGLEAKNVTVVDASTSTVVSAELGKPKNPDQLQAQVRNDLMGIQQQYQEYWQSTLTNSLERVVGRGNVMVVVNPIINWDKVVQQATVYTGSTPDGKGIVVSSQEQTETTDGAAGAGPVTPAGTPSNAELGTPTYPGANPQTGGTMTSEKQSKILNMLVNETRTSTEKPGGGLESISVGILVNSNVVTAADTEQKVNQAVAVAMGPRAQVQVSAVPFVPSIFDEPKPERPVVAGTTPNLLWWALGIGLGLGGVAAFFAFTKPRRPVLEQVFAGPEAAMLGGIPVTEMEMPPPVAASAEPQERRLPESADEVYALPPEEVATLGDEFLVSLGVDPSKVRMKEKVERVAKVQPDAVANLLRHWIAEERD